MGEVVWTRWLVYLVAGVPFLAWLFFTRDRVLQVISVLAMLIIVQNSFADRRFIWAIGVGPSNITAYTAFVSLFLARGGRMPTMRAAGPLWASLLFAALIGVMMGTFGGGLLDFNVANWQELFFEGFLFFVVGMLAFNRDEEVERFLFYAILLGLVVAVLHFFCLATGFRFRDFKEMGDDARQFLYGAMFSNANSLGAFYTMMIPMAVALVASGRLSLQRRAIAIAALILMAGSLLMTWHRGGFIVTSVLLLYVLARGRKNPATALLTMLAVAAVAAVGFVVVQQLVPDLFARLLETKGSKGLETERWSTWASYLPLILTNPFGVGLYGDDMMRLAQKHGIPFVPHNIYISLSLQIGILGVLSFLALVGYVVTRNLRASRMTGDPRQRLLLFRLNLVNFAFLMVGLAEPVFDNGYKLSQTFWLFAGVNLAMAQRVIAEARARSSEPASALPLEEARAHGL